MIGFRSKAVSKLETAGTSLDVTVPAGVVAGDVLLCWTYVTGNVTITRPAGWNLARTGAHAGGAATMGLFWRLADGTEPATYTFTFSTSQRAIATMAAYTGASPTSPVGSLTIAEPTTGAAIAVPARTAPVDNSWLLTTAGVRTSVDPGSTFTIDEATDAERSDDTTTGGTSGSRPSLAVYDSNAVLARGSVNDRVVTASTAGLSNGSRLGWATELISDETTGAGPLAFRGAVAGNAQTSSPTPATVDLAAPFVQDGDLLVAAVTRLGGSGVTPPAGFTRVPFTPTGSFEYQFWYKIANSEPATLTWVNGSASGSIYLTVALSAYSGANTSSPIGAWGYNQDTGNSAATPTITTRTDGSWVLSAIFKDAVSSGFTTSDVLDVERAEQLAQPSIGVYDSARTYPAASAVSRTLNNPGGASTAYLRFIAEIRPGIAAPSGPTVTFNHRETEAGWTERTGVPKAWTGGPEWVEAPGRYWDGAAWLDLP